MSFSSDDEEEEERKNLWNYLVVCGAELAAYEQYLSSQCVIVTGVLLTGGINAVPFYATEQAV